METKRYDFTGFHTKQETRNEEIGKIYQYLDKGEVVLVDVMGCDDTIAEVARTSYGGGGDTKKRSSSNADLINYLMSHRHTSPFEFCEMYFRIVIPLVPFNQLVRHRTANINAMSYRYTEAKDDFYIPSVENVTEQSKTNKQAGTSVVVNNAEEMVKLFEDISSHCLEQYRHMVSNGVRKELAREIIPQNAYTTIMWKMDLHNLLHFLHLRNSEHAQLEIRELAKIIETIVEKCFPIVYKAYVNYIRDSKTFSKNQYKFLRELINANARFGPSLFIWKPKDEDGKEILSLREYVYVAEEFLDSFSGSDYWLTVEIDEKGKCLEHFRNQDLKNTLKALYESGDKIVKNCVDSRWYLYTHNKG